MVRGVTLVYCLAALAGYLLGSVPTGYLVGRAHGIDVRAHGSGNIGATNVVRVLGRGPGTLVFVCDALKGLAATLAGALLVWLLPHPGWVSGPLPPPAGAGATGAWVASQLHAMAAHYRAVAAVIGGLACVLGHNFPVWLRFRGGKGIATTAGVLLGLMPLAVAAAGVVWAVAFYTLRYVSVASMLAAAALPVTVALMWRAGWADALLFYFSLAAAALAILRHKTNIERLLKGTETRFARKPKTAA